MYLVSIRQQNHPCIMFGHPSFSPHKAAFFIEVLQCTTLQFCTVTSGGLNQGDRPILRNPIVNLFQTEQVGYLPSDRGMVTTAPSPPISHIFTDFPTVPIWSLKPALVETLSLNALSLKANVFQLLVFVAILRTSLYHDLPQLQTPVSI